MKKLLIPCLVFYLLMGSSFGQDIKTKDYRNFPLSISLQFHSFSMPFRNLKSNFQNIGIGIGTEISHNAEHTWIQEISLIWVHNKSMGDGLFFLTQTAWRPYLADPLFGEIKLGLGYHLAFRPTESFIQKDGEWISARKKGKSMLAIPAGIGIGSHSYSEKSYTSPFVNYQFLLLKGFNATVPIVPETLIQVGTRTHF